MKEKEINTGNSCNKEDWSKLDANKTMLNHGYGLEVRSFASNLPEEMSMIERAAKWSNERDKEFEELVKPLNEWLPFESSIIYRRDIAPL